MKDSTAHLHDTIFILTQRLIEGEDEVAELSRLEAEVTKMKEESFWLSLVVSTMVPLIFFSFAVAAGWL